MGARPCCRQGGIASRGCPAKTTLHEIEQKLLLFAQRGRDLGETNARSGDLCAQISIGPLRLLPLRTLMLEEKNAGEETGGARQGPAREGGCDRGCRQLLAA